MWIALLFPLLATGPDLPGPASFGAVVLPLYFVMLMATVIGVVFVLPASLIWVVLGCWRRWRGVTDRINRTPVLLIGLVAAAVFSVTAVRELTRSMAAERAIGRAAPLIDALEAHRSETGRYPETLEEIASRLPRGMPTPGSMGSVSFDYEIREDAYDLSFAQCENLGCFNPYVYVFNPNFNPNDAQRGIGAIPRLLETSHPHWRYYVYD
jgi:hypothetical protein